MLAGHRQDGKYFSCLPESTTGVSYTEIGVPEIAWIAVTIEDLGMKSTASVIEIIANEIRDESVIPPPLLATFVAKLPEEQQGKIIHKLKEAGLMNPLKTALSRFTSLYPNFPATWLSGKPDNVLDSNYLKRFKIILGELLDKSSVRSSLVLAQLVYGALVSDSIKVQPGMLDNLEEIRDYPKTEGSQILAAKLRSITTLLIGQSQEESSSVWSDYFWKRGFELEPINYSSIWNN